MNTNIFTLLVRKELVDNRKPLMLGLIGAWATYVLTGGFLGYAQVQVSVELFIFCFFSTMIMAVGASLAFNNMKTKEGRINALMLPAPISHKFAVRWLAAVPLLLLVVILGCLFGDWVRLAVYKLLVVPVEEPVWNSSYTTPNISAISYIILNFNEEPQAIWMIINIVLTSALCSQAAYFLGGIVWPRLSFIKTWALLQVLALVAATVMVSISFRLREFAVDLEYVPCVVLLNCVGLIVCVGLYWLAYERFKRSQVIYKLFS